MVPIRGAASVPHPRRRESGEPAMPGSIITWRIGEDHRSGAAWERLVADALVVWA